MRTDELDRRVWLPWALGVLLAVCLLYGSALENGFHFDDFHTVTDNPAVRSLGNIPAFFRDATLFSVLPANRTYRPVVSTSLALDYALGHGYKPFWFHLSTLLWLLVLLACLGLLYFRAMVAVRPDTPRRNALWAVAGMAWFGLHPAMAETVNYVIQRGDVYCTLGCVAALALWACLPAWRRFGVYLLPLAVALLSKPPAAVFPALLLLWVYFFEAGGDEKARWRRALVATLPSVAVVLLLLAVQSHLTPKTFLPSELSAGDYRMTQPLVWLRYCGELFLPLHLNVDTDLPAYSEMNGADLLGLLFVLALAAAIVFTVRRRSLYPIAFGLLWFVVTQLPTSLYPLSEVENDHRMFFSFAGLMLAVLFAVRLAAERVVRAPRPAWLPKALVACGFLLLAGYAWGTHVRNEVWRTEDTLWADDAQKSPHNGRGLMNYGLTLMARGQYPAAKAEFEQALRYTPNYPTLEINLGVVNGTLGLPADAEQHFQRALLLAPGDDQAPAYYGRWLLDQGRTAEAIPQLQRAVQLNGARPMQRDLLARALAQPPVLPGVPLTPAVTQQMTEADWINRSLALNKAGLLKDSIAAARQALILNPRSAAAWNNVAAGYEGEKKWDPAIDAARRAVALEPGFTLAQNNLAWSLRQKALEAATRQR